jgi:selenoprotein W-related protein
MVPGSGGVFEVTVNGKLIFSKKETGVFPDHEEIIKLMEEL